MKSVVLTCAIAVVIFDPPEPPTTTRATPFLSTKMDGAIEDWGLLPGRRKFASEGRMPYAFFLVGIEKSSNSLLYIIPVRMERYLLPKLHKK